MKKIANIFKYFFIIVLFLSIICINNFLNNLEPYDELWNFQNVMKIYNNNLIYTDANVIITPIFFEIGNLFLHIFGDNLNSFRIYNVCIYSLIFIQSFIIFKQLKVRKDLALLYIALTLSTCYSSIAGGANYNTLAILFMLFGISHYIKYHEKKFFNLFQGFIIYLIFFTKQNLGVFYVLGTIAFELWNSKSLKSTFINFLKRFFSFLIPASITLLIMYSKGNLVDFINMAFGGLFNFGSSNLFVDNLIFSASFITITIFFLYFLKKKLIPEEHLKNSKLIFCVAISSVLSIFPIVNTVHMMFVYIIFYILFFYILDFSFLSEVFYTEKHNLILNACTAFTLIGVILHLLTYYYPNLPNIGNVPKESHFYNALIEPEILEKIDNMSEYISNKNNQGIDVIIVASDAAYTMINLNQSHGAFDLAFNGNLGYNGANKLIEKIKSSFNTEYLIYTNEEDIFWQESTEIREFIINNLEKTGEVENYTVYYKK